MFRPVLLWKIAEGFSSNARTITSRLISTTSNCKSLSSQAAGHNASSLPPLSVLPQFSSTRYVVPFRKSITDPNLPLISPQILPSLFEQVKLEPLPHLNVIEAPAFSKIEKQAARMVVIRKRKMKKHKLRKLRKRMKYVYLKINQRRKARKEKAFQDSLMAQITEAEQFDPKSYVQEFIKQAKEEIVLTQKFVTLNKRNPARYDAEGNKVGFRVDRRK